jgi:hypothetical protein
MRRRLTRTGLLLLALAALAIGGSAIASAAHRSAPPAAPAAAPAPSIPATDAETPDSSTAADAKDTGTETAGETKDTGTESDVPSAAEIAACKAAGLDPNADNINYDDATGTCTVDSGNSND